MSSQTKQKKKTSLDKVLEARYDKVCPCSDPAAVLYYFCQLRLSMVKTNSEGLQKWIPVKSHQTVINYGCLNNTRGDCIIE